MDYHSLKRRELQALCKEHNIPANSANSVLADKLSALLNEKQKPKTQKQTCMKNSVETIDEGEPAASKRQTKKVRFSPNNDLFEYELQSGKKQKDMVRQTKTRRKSVAKVAKPVVENNLTVELVEDTAQIPVRATRSRVQSLGKDVIIPNNEKKPSTGKKKVSRGAKDTEKGTDVDNITEGNVGKVTRSKAHTLENDGVVKREESKQSKRLIKEEEATETVEETVVGRVRVTRSKAHTLMEGGTGRDANPHIKKKTGKQVKTDGQSVEPSKEIMDIPVRATRSTRQSLKEDIGNAVTNPQAGKKRTRREMKATDLSSSLSHVAPVDKQEPLKRKSLRTRGEETVDEGESDKMEVVNDSRVTRSNVSLAMEASGRNSRNKTNTSEIQQLEVPSMHAGKKSVNRRKSVLQPEKTEVDSHLEIPVNHPARKKTRQKSVMQKAAKTVESPTVEKNRSKGLSKDNVTRSGKDASENDFEEATTRTSKSRKQRGTPIIEDHIIEPEHGSLVDKSPKISTRSGSKSKGKSVAKNLVESSCKNIGGEAPTVGKKQSKGLSKENVTRSGKDASKYDFEEATTWTPKSRKRRGTPITEDHIIETEHGSLVDKSPKLSIRSASKIEGKSVAKKLVESSLKKPMSRLNDNPSVENASLEGKSSAIISAAIIRGSTSKKRAKLSETKQSDSEDHAVIFSKEGTPAAKKRNFKLDEVTEPEVTPAIDKSDRHFTRSAIRSERKGPSQSAIKEQPIAEAQLFSPKAPKFRPNPAVNTAPGPITRRGIKHGGNAAGSFSEKVGKKKQTRQSGHKKPLDDAQMASPKVAEVGSEISKEVTSQVLGGLSASESVRLPSKIMENTGPMSGTAIDMERASDVSGENASGEVMEDAGACIENSTYVASATPCLPEILHSGKQQNPSELPSSDNETPFGENISHIKMTSVPMAGVAETVPDAVLDVSNVQNQNVDSETVNLETSVLKSGTPDAREQEMTESGSTSKGMQTDVMIEEPLDSVGKADVVEEGVDISYLGVNTKVDIGDAGDNSDHISYDVDSSAVCHSSIQQSDVKSDFMLSAWGDKRGGPGSLQISSVDIHDITGDGEHCDEDESSTQKPSEPDSVDGGVADRVDVQKNPFSCNDVYGECDNAISDSKSRMDMFGSPLIGKGDVGDDGINVSKEHGTASELSNANKTLEVPISGTDIDIEHALENNSDVHDVGDDGINVPKEHGTASELSNVNKTLEVPISGTDIDIEHALENNSDVHDVGDDGINVPKEHGTASELSNVNKTLEVPISGTDIDIEHALENNSDVHDGESEHDQLASNDNHATDEEDVGGDDSEPAPNESMPVATEVLVRSCDQEPEQLLTVAVGDATCDTVGQLDSVTNKDTPETLAASGIDDIVVRVDAPEESLVDIHKDVVSSVLGDTNDMDTQGDGGNMQRLTEFDEGFQPNESEGIFFDVSNDQIKEEAQMSRGNDHKLDDQGPEAATDDDLDGAKFMEDGSHIGVNLVNSELVENIKAHEELTREEASPVLYTKETTVDGMDSSQLMGDVHGHESLITEESLQITYKKEEFPVDDTDLDLPTIKEDDKNNQEETQNAGTFVDWGDYDLGTEEFGKPVSADRSADIDDDQDSDLQTSARICSSIQESSGLEAGLTNSVKKLERDSRNASDGKCNQEIDMLKESSNAADMTEVFNWSGSDLSLKPLFAMPSATRIGHVRDSQEDAVKLASQESSQKPLVTTPATNQSGLLKDAREEATSFANKDHYSSLESLFTTPTPSGTSHGNDCKNDAVNFTFPDGKCNEDIGSSRTAAHEFNHQWEDVQSKVFDGETQCNAGQGPEHEIHGDPSFEDYSFKLFEDEDEHVGGSIDKSGSSTQFEFRQFESLNEAAGTSQHDSSGLKDNPIRSHEFEKKEDIPPKGLEVIDDLVFDTGHHDYSGSTTGYSNK